MIKLDRPGRESSSFNIFYSFSQNSTSISSCVQTYHNYSNTPRKYFFLLSISFYHSEGLNPNNLLSSKLHFVISLISSFYRNVYFPELLNLLKLILAMYSSLFMFSSKVWNPFVSYLLFISQAVSKIIVHYMASNRA